jgi:hypothetical protein
MDSTGSKKVEVKEVKSMEGIDFRELFSRFSTGRLKRFLCNTPNVQRLHVLV